jgi:acetyl-CoA carboxylase biotin carboxyl carrier protein
MIDIRKLKELVKLMVANDLSEMDLRDSDEQVTIRRHGDVVVTAPSVVNAASPNTVETTSQVAVLDSSAVVSTQNQGTEEGTPIVSPMVGTFFASSDPDSPAFVKVGDAIGEDTTVCVIEAMKIFNEINAQCSGVIVKVLVSNGDPVEFGQTLFLVKK